MMRVLAFTDVALPEGGGGVERTLREVYGRIAESGQAEIHLVALSTPGLPTLEQRDGITVHRTGRLSLERLTGMQVAISTSAWGLGAHLARELRPDVIHAHTLFFSSSIVAAAIARRQRLPLLLTVHVGPIAALPQPARTAVSAYERVVGRWLLATARRVICVSDDVERHVLSLGAAPEKVTTIPNGVDLERFAPREVPRACETTPPVVLSVGRLIGNKGIGDLVMATDLLHGRGIAFQLRIAGDGPLRRRLEADVARRGLNECVSFLGHVETVEELLRDVDVFVRPSLTDGMPLAVLEAMATGLPVVATDISGSRELIQPCTNGLLVPPGNPEQLSLALESLLRDPGRRAAMGRAARRGAAEYGWDRVADETAREFARAAA